LLLENLKAVCPQSQHYIENEWLNFVEYTIVMEENEWEDDDVKEFARLVEQSKRTWKPVKKEL
jgi:hypothetical protein